ncbi:MAG TPA: DUF4190 domain-containing protein [Mycobacterium sp.]|nr:DUF4190 domain-containing protein [Mycobacterium sp.]
MTTPDQPFQPPDEPNPPAPDNPYSSVNYPEYPSGYPPPPPSGYPPPPPYQGYPPPYPGAPVGPTSYDPYRAAAQQTTNPMAVVSLVCSLGGLFCGVTAIAGVILGFIAMQQTKQTGQNGYGLALAGVITGAVMLVLWVGWLMVTAAT